MQTWQEATAWEQAWHGNCINSYAEETKQLVYAEKMGLVAQAIGGKFPVYDLKGQSVLDIGGGPYSMLLKSINFTGTVLDPCDYPGWVTERYKAAEITQIKQKAEEATFDKVFDLILIYNVLQHVDDPIKVINTARRYGRLILICDWIDSPVTDGHIHELKENKLNEWLHGKGYTDTVNINYCTGRFYYGAFAGAPYALSCPGPTPHQNQ